MSKRQPTTPAKSPLLRKISSAFLTLDDFRKPSLNSMKKALDDLDKKNTQNRWKDFDEMLIRILFVSKITLRPEIKVEFLDGEEDKMIQEFMVKYKAPRAEVASNLRDYVDYLNKEYLPITIREFYKLWGGRDLRPADFLRPKKSLAESDNSQLPKITYLSLSPFRVFTSDDLQFSIAICLNKLLVEAVIAQTFAEAFGEKADNFYRTLPFKYSKQDHQADFLRDKAVQIGDGIYCPDPKISNAYINSLQQREAVWKDLLKRVKRGESSNYNEEEIESQITNFTHVIHRLDQVKSAVADIEAALATIPKLKDKARKIESSLPFLTCGGEMVFFKESNGKENLIIVLSDNFYSSHTGEFMLSHYLDDRGNVVECKNEEEMGRYVKNYFSKTHGIETHIVKRNAADLNDLGDDRLQFTDIYHLDTFLNVADNVLIVAKQALTAESWKILEKKFNKENIIAISEDDRRALATNFIQIGKNLIFCNPDISDDLTRKLNEKGFNVFLTAVHVGVENTDGLRCHTLQLNWGELREAKEVEARNSSGDEASEAPSANVVSRELQGSQKYVEEVSKDYKGQTTHL